LSCPGLYLRHADNLDQACALMKRLRNHYGKGVQDIFQFFRGLGYSGVLLLGNTYLHYSNPDNVPHYKFGMVGHRDFLFFPPESIGTTIPINLSRQFPQIALDF
jgi:hypothetical protein